MQDKLEFVFVKGALLFLDFNVTELYDKLDLKGKVENEVFCWFKERVKDRSLSVLISRKGERLGSVTEDIVIELLSANKHWFMSRGVGEKEFELFLEEFRSVPVTYEDYQLAKSEIERRWRRGVIIDIVKAVEQYLLKEDKESDLKLFNVLRSFFVQFGKRVYSSSVSAYDGYVVDEDLLTSFEKRLIRRVDTELALLKTGFPTLDRLIGGGIRRGTLSVFLGATNVGKTNTMVYLTGVSSIQGLNVLYVTLEDLKHVIEDKLDRFYVGSDLLERVSSVDVEDYYAEKELNMIVEQLMSRVNTLRRYVGKVFVVFKYPCSIHDLEVFLSEMGNIDVLVIDYGDLLSEASGVVDDKEFIRLGHVFRELVRIALKYDIWVITGSQTTRGAIRDKELDLAHTARSFRKVEAAHYVFGISPKTENILKLTVLKNRFGNKGFSITCFADWKNLQLREIEEEGEEGRDRGSKKNKMQ